MFACRFLAFAFFLVGLESIFMGRAFAMDESKNLDRVSDFDKYIFHEMPDLLKKQLPDSFKKSQEGKCYIWYYKFLARRRHERYPEVKLEEFKVAMDPSNFEFIKRVYQHLTANRIKARAVIEGTEDSYERIDLLEAQMRSIKNIDTLKHYWKIKAEMGDS